MSTATATAPQLLEFRCTRCWHSNCVSSERCGQSVACSNCGGEQTVPEATPARIARAAELLCEPSSGRAVVPEKNYEDLSDAELRVLVQRECLGEEAADGPIASCLSRFFANLIDSFATMLAMGLGLLATWLAEQWGLVEPLQPEQPLRNVDKLAVMFFPLLGFLIVQWNLIATRGQTVGKMLLWIRIIRCDGGSPGFIQGVLLRNWLRLALSAIPFFSLIDVMLIFTESRRCIHDYLAGTRVVEV